VQRSNAPRQSYAPRWRSLVLRDCLIALPAIPASALTTIAAAQGVEATLDAGATGIRYADSIGTVAASLSPAVRVQSGRATVGAAGSISELGADAWTAQASLDASTFTPSIATLRGELAGSAGGSAHEDGTRTGQLEALGRIHLMRGVWGLWAGGGAGRAWDGTSGRVLVLGDAGAWLRRGSFTAVLSAMPTAVADSLRYTDVGLAVRWVRAHGEIGATFGTRAGHGLIAGSTTWGAIGGVAWLTSHVGIVAGAGTYPPDLAQGFPNGRYFSLALRLDNHRRWPREVPGPVVPPGDEAASRDGMPIAGRTVVEQFVAASSGEERTVRVRAPRATHVELAGDMTNWTPVALTSAGDGWWTTTLTVPAGVHQVSLRLEGGQWVAPPGLVAVTDEFGGAAGVWNAP
jgi:hypothetical protein